MTVQHIQRSPGEAAISTYCSTLRRVDGKGRELNKDWTHPGSFTISSPTTPVVVHLYHGRLNPDADMDDWGFDGPEFNCLTIAHDPDRTLLQGCDAHSLQLASRMGLSVTGDTIAIEYLDDLLVVPAFRDCSTPAYFGDHSMTATEN